MHARAAEVDGGAPDLLVLHDLVLVGLDPGAAVLRARQLRAIEQLAVAFGRLDHDRLELFDGAPDFHQAADVLLQDIENLGDLADPLAGEILEIAGLVDPQDLVADVAGQAHLVLALERRGQRVGALVDLLGGAQNLLCRLLGIDHDRLELAAGPRHGVQAGGA